MSATPEGLTAEPIERPPPSAVFTGLDKRYGAPAASYLYEDQAGRLFYQCRYEVKAAPQDGQEAGKTYRPWVWSAEKATWVSRGPAHPTPLYHLNLLQASPDAPVYVVEGEKCADALQALVSAAGRPGVVVSAWGGASSVKHARWEVLAGRRCILWPDNDDVGRQAMAFAAQRLFSLRAKVAIVDVPRGTTPEHWDVADAIVAGWSLEQLKDFVQANLRQITTAPLMVVEVGESRKPARAASAGKPARTVSHPPADDGQTDAWRHWGLALKKGGFPWENTENVCRVLAHLNDGETFGKIWYDEFAVRIMTADGRGGERIWEESDTIAVQCFLQADIGMPTVRKHIVDDAILRHARAHTRHPLREWLQSLRWDGVDRLPTMLAQGWGAKQNDYTAAVGRCFLIGAVARIMRPGEKVDNVPVFEGPERGQKTMALETLASIAWYDCPQYKIGDRDFYLSLRGKWIIELGELSNTEGVTHTSLRAALSKRYDNFRGPFERQSSDHPRMAVFAATTNSDHWHNDPHGAGRFWPIWCTKINRAWIQENREQLFAEAVARLDRYEKWWDVPHDAAQAEREERREGDEGWEDAIRGYLTGKQQVTIREVLVYGLDMPSAKEHSLNVTKRVGAVLRQLHWRRISKRIPGASTPAKVWVYSEALERAAADDVPLARSQSDLEGF